MYQKHITFYLLFFILVSFFSSQACAQQPLWDTLITKKPVLRFNLVGLGWGIEAPATKQITLYIEGGASFDEVGFINLRGMRDIKLIAIPYASLQLRYYYNLLRRKRLKKAIHKFSANYIALAAPYITATTYTDLISGIGPVWGMQRSFAKHGYWSFHIGPGLYRNTGDNPLQAAYYLNVNTFAAIGVVF